ncbi:MAG: aminotransferase class III-fold pyridoxal phosphate-dependent enzyme [Gammaproteobacteria bacterium]|nr:aminotransferase class III-fold pyridoxal phosphate-dependent enzyme [Gammaproteobacteria bacterium]
MTDSFSSSSVNQQLLDRRQRLLGPAYRLFYETPLHIVRGEGVWLIDADGRRYLDMYNNVPHVGHCHPHVVAAVCEQIGVLNTHTRYLHENVLAYAERLLNRFPSKLDVAMFSCTGTEANELALRIARSSTGGTGLIVAEHAYHGNSHAIAEISTEDNTPADRSDYIVTVPPPDIYRGQYRDADAAERYAAHLHAAIDTLDRRGIVLAAFVVDTIFSSSGVIAPPPGYLKLAADIVRAAGGLFVADEVQPGFGRTGRSFWGFEADGVLPDIVTMGKPMGNGHPLAATIAKRSLVEKFASKTGYFNTFGGNPVSAAAGMAVLDVIEGENLQENALAVGRHLQAGVRAIAKTRDVIGDVRGNGLFVAIELVDAGEARRPAAAAAGRVVNDLRNRGILTNTMGADGNILKLRPPMVFNKDNADFFLGHLDEALAAI